MTLLDLAPFDFGQVSTQEDAHLVDLVLAAEQNRTGNISRSSSEAPGDVKSSGMRLPAQPSNGQTFFSFSARLPSSSGPLGVHQKERSIQNQPRQLDRSMPQHQSYCQPEPCSLRAVYDTHGDDIDSRAQRPSAPSGGAPPVLGKRKLPNSFSRQQTGQPAALSTLRPLCLPKGCITYASLPEEVEHVCNLVHSSGVEAVGFDIEWRVTYRTGETPRPAALMQLALRPSGGGYRVFLLHVCHSGLTLGLLALLRSPAVRKAGVGCSGDAQKLMRDFGVDCEGLVDLSEEANLRLCGPGSGRLPEKWSLARLASTVLGAELSKDQGLRTSNWEAWPLSLEQQHYAALDAFASLLLYQRIMAMPLPQLPAVPEEPEGEASGDEQSPLDVPAEPTVAPLQPAKMAVWRLFMEQGASIRAIAQQRNIQRDSVEGYLAEAITAGAAYAWHRAHVTRATLAAVAAAAARHLRPAAAARRPEPSAQQECSAHICKAAASAAPQQQRSQQSSCAPPPCGPARGPSAEHRRSAGISSAQVLPARPPCALGWRPEPSAQQECSANICGAAARAAPQQRRPCAPPSCGPAIKPSAEHRFSAGISLAQVAAAAAAAQQQQGPPSWPLCASAQRPESSAHHGGSASVSAGHAPALEDAPQQQQTRQRHPAAANCFQRGASPARGQQVSSASEGSRAAAKTDAAACHEGLQAQQVSRAVVPGPVREGMLESSSAACACARLQSGQAEGGDHRGKFRAPNQDLVRLLADRGVSVKMLKEQLPGSIRYGHIRLCLAHVGRLGLLPELLGEVTIHETCSSIQDYVSGLRNNQMQFFL